MIEIIPNWHPIFVHFSVALLTLSVVFHLLERLTFVRGLRAELQVVARWLLWLGTAFAVVTAATGWLAYNSVAHDDASHAAMTDHRNWALTTLGVFAILALWSLWAWLRKREPVKGAAAFVFLTVLVAGGGLLAGTAWRGGELVYRHGLGVMSLPIADAVDLGARGKSPESPVAAPAGAVPVKPEHDHSTHKH